MPHLRDRHPNPLRLTLLAAACVAVTGVARAQEAPPAGTSAADMPQRVEVTGSRIKRIDNEGVSPVQVIRREDILATGATTVSQMLNTLTASSSTGALNDIGGGNSFSPGASQAECEQQNRWTNDHARRWTTGHHAT
jgi:iron complex outermembrane receptor protein